ncbi:MAG: hypothetical protein M3N45_09275 [Actinomycetota bacterium]|nr:hypothetical protein [Actinomycetota bacterium]
MCDERTSGHPELWRAGATLPADRGPEGNLKMWQEAEGYLDYLATKAEDADAAGGEGAYVALVDAHNRCIEARRRAQDLVKLHERWSERRIGGVTEPKPVIVPKGGGAD